MEKFVIDGYLTEKKLGEFLNYALPDVKVKRQVKTQVSRVDYAFTFNGKLHYIEFDGYQHYTKATQQAKDMYMDLYCEENGIVLIRIPYFIQLRQDSLAYIFGREIYEYMEGCGVVVDCCYPHGFIDKKAILPFDYCGIGLMRFLKQATSISIINGDDKTYESWIVGREIQSSILHHMDRIGIGISEVILMAMSDEFITFINSEFT